MFERERVMCVREIVMCVRERWLGRKREKERHLNDCLRKRKRMT